MFKAIVGALVASAWFASAPAFAVPCDTRAPHVQFARDNLRRAAAEGDLPTAQDFADRARRQMEQLARSAERCGCAAARPQFEAAAVELRKGRDAESRRQVRQIVEQALPLFEDALAAMRRCSTD